jgi:hypothetical protein
VPASAAIRSLMFLGARLWAAHGDVFASPLEEQAEDE